MDAVIVGPMIEPSVSVFAFEPEGCGTTVKENWLTSRAVMADMAEHGPGVRAIKPERGCFEAQTGDGNGADLYVNPGTALKPEARCEDRS